LTRKEGTHRVHIPWTSPGKKQAKRKGNSSVEGNDMGGAVTFWWTGGKRAKKISARAKVKDNLTSLTQKALWYHRNSV